MNATKHTLNKALHRFRVQERKSRDQSAVLLLELWECPEWDGFTKGAVVMLVDAMKFASVNPIGSGPKVLSAIQGMLDTAFLAGYRTRELLETPAPKPLERVQ